MKKFIGIILSLVSLTVSGQPFGEEVVKRGYLHQNDSTTFVFDEDFYQVKPHRVWVTGSFRNWDSQIQAGPWELKKFGKSQWILKVANPEFKVIQVSSGFKYRINEGKWLDPPSGSLDTEGGNLIFMKGIKPPRVRPELVANDAIWIKTEGLGKQLSWNPDHWKLTNSQGELIPVAEVLPYNAGEALLKPSQSIDKRRIYYLEFTPLKIKTLCSFDGWFKTLYSEKELGANVSADGKQTTFRVFSPRATGVKLYLYADRTSSKETSVHELTIDPQGVWEITLPGDLHGTWYDFTVHGFNDPGNHFFETTGQHVSDPYARVIDDTFGKSRVWRKTKAATPLKNGRPPMQDVIAYEVHVQDFTDQLPIDPSLQGTIPAMIMPGLKNKKGQKIGFDYLTELGINTVHLMPVQEFLHFPDEDWQKHFKDDPYMISQGVNMENYDWGYRTSHAFAVETRFRKKGTEHGAQRDQFRDLVQAFHDKGIAVIVDFVFNHTAENMDGRSYYFAFNAFDKQYYYRTKNLEHIGEYGNETKSENRPMVQRWIIDQCKHFIEEFGVDGFRIDLAGQTDQQTLRKLREALGPDVIIYGEPWIGSNDPDYEANPDWDWYKEDSPITFFQDDARNAFKGPVSNPQDKAKDRGYAGGDGSQREKVMKGLTCTFPEEKSPLSGINYLDIHDNWALADQFATKDWDGRFGVDESRYKIAALLLYTSLGPIVTHGGSEIMRSKGSSPLMEIIKENGTGKLYFHGKRDTYNVRKPNQFVWNQVGTTTGEKDIFCDYKGMHAYWRALNKFRTSSIGKIFRQELAVPTDYYRFILPKNEQMLGYVVNKQVLTLINTSDQEQIFDAIELPAGTWKLIGNGREFNHEKGVRGANQNLVGGKKVTIKCPPASGLVWLKIK